MRAVTSECLPLYYLKSVSVKERYLVGCTDLLEKADVDEGLCCRWNLVGSDSKQRAQTGNVVLAFRTAKSLDHGSGIPSFCQKRVFNPFSAKAR